MKIVLVTFIFLLILVTTLITSCSSNEQTLRQNLLAMETIKLVYQDSSTPPKYHRSYTITITAESIKCIVDSYGTILADETYPFSQKQFQTLVDKSKTLQAPDTKITKLAEGTYAYGIYLMDNTREVYKLYWDSSQGKEITTKTLEYVKLLQATVPNLSELKNKPLTK